MTHTRKKTPPLLIYAAAAAILLALGTSYYRNSRLTLENQRLGKETADLSKQMTTALHELGKWQTNAAQVGVRLAEATNALAALPPKDETQERVHEKLRVEIARLSEENVRKDTLIETMKGQAQALQESKGKTEASLQAVQAALATTSNEVVRLRTSDADKAARLAARDQELANVRSELAASNKAGQEAAAGKTAAEKTVQELQAKSGADQAELARLKQRLAELEAEKAKLAAPAPAPASVPTGS